MVLPLRTFGPVKKIFLAIVDSSKSFKRTSPFSLYLNNDAVIDFVPFLKPVQRIGIFSTGNDFPFRKKNINKNKVVFFNFFNFGSCVYFNTI